MGRIGIALSGGGHRATIWGIGVLLYIADAGRQGDVGVIASVSGGSIANGVIAHEMDYAKTGADEVRSRLRPLLRHVACTGLFFWGPSTNLFVITLLSLLGIGMLGFIAGLILAFVGGIGTVSGVVILASLAVFAAGAMVFSRRSVIVDSALARTHFHRNGRATRLEEVARSLDHVMCATELQSGEHFYFAPTFLYSYRFGCGRPRELQLSTAVQASACLPGAFAARRLATAPYKFRRSASVTEPATIPGQMLLTDGGVYDNMADQWMAGLASRMQENAGLQVMAPVLDQMIVVNSSAGPHWTTVPASWLLIRNELSTLARVKDVQYAVSTSTRRHQLVTGWDAAADKGRGARGALVHIAQSPFEVPDAFAHAATASQQGSRAHEALAWLGDTPENRAAWAETARLNRAVPTVLRKLDPDPTARLLWHAYVLAAANLHVILDDFPLPTQLPTKEDFGALINEPGHATTAP
jgi:predicted acylesterase/phospholipase RssA